jgi:hypothetical protein
VTLLTPDGCFDRAAILRDARRGFVSMRRHGWGFSNSALANAGSGTPNSGASLSGVTQAAVTTVNSILH